MKFFGCNLYIENDVNVIAYGEYILRKDKVEDVVTIAIGTDIGVGIVLGGKLYAGKNGTAGEIVHIQLDPSQKVCPECNMNGCVSVMCGGANIVESFNTESADIKIESVEELYRYANDGINLAVRHRDNFQKNLAKSIRLLHLLLDPELI